MRHLSTERELRRVSLRWLLALLPLALAGGCGAEQPAARAEPLRVAAASDLQQALSALVEQFRKSHKGEVVTTFGSSGQLAEQIKQGAPFDVFLAANEAYVNGLAQQGIVTSDSVRLYARGTLVLAVHREAGAAIERLSDLTKPEVKRVALANPDFAPYGAAAKQALERAGLWQTLEPKRVQAESVRQALQFVQSGNAEAGFVGKAIARVPEVRTIELDPALYEPIVQALGVVAASKQKDEAEAFAAFILGEEGQAVLARFGFLAPGQAKGASTGND